MRRLAALLSSYFVSQDLEATVLTNRKYENRDFELGKTERLFEYSQYSKAARGAPSGFVPQLLEWTSSRRMDDAIFIYPTINSVFSEEIAKFIAVSSPRAIHVLVMMLDAGTAGPADQPTIVDHDIVERFRASFAAIRQAANRKVVIVAPSRTMAAHVRYLSALPVTEVAPPLSIDRQRIAVPDRPGTDSYTLGLYLGAAEKDKGFNHLPSVIGMIGRAAGPEWSKVRVHIQSFGVSSYAEEIQAVIAAVGQAPFAGRFDLETRRLPDLQYEGLLGSLDAAVLGYSPARYGGKTSGVFWELKSIGVPVAVPNGTWMSSEASSLAGTTFMIDGFSAEATFNAARELVLKRPMPVRDALPSWGAAAMGRQILAEIAAVM